MNNEPTNIKLTVWDNEKSDKLEQIHLNVKKVTRHNYLLTVILIVILVYWYLRDCYFRNDIC